MPLDEHEAKALADIEAYGCHILRVLGTDQSPKFTYSIGIERTLKQPELIVTGLDPDLAQSAINEYHRRLRSGEIFVSGELYQDFLEGFPVRFEPVLRGHYPDYFGWAFWLYDGPEFRVNQMVWPSTTGDWPWDDTASEEYLWHMPLLWDPGLLH